MLHKYFLPPRVNNCLVTLGRNINEARRRRRTTMAIMAERAGISRITLGKIERGDASVSMGAYASVLYALGMESQLGKLGDAPSDLIGIDLESMRLPKRIRMPKNPDAFHA